MTDLAERSDQPRTCWSCEGSGQRYVTSKGRAHKQPCPVCLGTGLAYAPPRPAERACRTPRWLRVFRGLF
ncbi:MAG: hypothetical protein AAGH68_08540 [Pseudomonadota bacterium]